MSELERGKVIALYALHGFTVVGTGGGCEALEKKLPGLYIWVTFEDDASIPETVSSPAMACLYAESGPDHTETLGFIHAQNSEQLLAKIGRGEWRRDPPKVARGIAIPDLGYYDDPPPK